MRILKKYIKKIIITAAMLLPVFAISAHAQSVPPVPPGEFPFFRSFLDGNSEYVAFPVGSPSNGIDRKNATDEESLNIRGLILTQGISQVGAFFLPQHRFSTEDGFLIEFEYIMEGPGDLTDGITMFLVDANDDYIGSNLKFGAAGAGFGYTHRLGFKTENRLLGIKGAYLAVALDQGPFKTNRMVDKDWGDEMRNGMVYNTNPNSTTGALDPKYDTRSNITIRGAAGNGEKKFTVANTNYTRNKGEWGYPVLATRHTGMKSNNVATGMENDAGFKLNTSNGLFIKEAMPVIPKPFNIAGGGGFSSPEEAAYRKAIIALESNTNEDEGGFKITVTIQHGKEKTTVIEKFTYPSQVTYIENGYPTTWNTSLGYAQMATSPPPVTYIVPKPEKLVIGFTASTGWDTAYTNIIKNLRITPIYAANTANDDIRDHRRGPVTIRPFDNDLGYQKSGSSHIGDKDFLDPATFRFWTSEYECEGEGNFEITSSGEGKWVYDPSTSEVLFFPDKGFVGKAEIRYDIKGTYPPFDEEKYRSAQAIISVTIADNQP